MRAQRAKSSHADVDEIVNDVNEIDTPPNKLAAVAPFIFAANTNACESRTQDLETITFYFANVQGVVSNSADLALFIKQQSFPEIVGFI